jgi:hypothetical protein
MRDEGSGMRETTRYVFSPPDAGYISHLSSLIPAARKQHENKEP